jgi:hypothetical protein
MTATHDVFYGGSRDGQRFDLDGNLSDGSRISDAVGGIYARHPDFDTETDRAWFNLPNDQPTAANGVHIEPQPGAKFLTLADLRNLVITAERMGHSADAVVHGRVAWRGQVQLLGIKAAGVGKA